MRNLTDADIRCFAFAGCNANEIAAYGGFSVSVARARLARALKQMRGGK